MRASDSKSLLTRGRLLFLSPDAHILHLHFLDAIGVRHRVRFLLYFFKRTFYLVISGLFVTP